MSYFKDFASIDVGKPLASIAGGFMAGGVAAWPGSFAGLIVAFACLPGPASGEIVMALPVLGGSMMLHVTFL